MEGPGAVLRMVEACDFTDLTEAADDRTRVGVSLVDARDGVWRRVDLVDNEVESSLFVATDLTDEIVDFPVCPGESLESGLRFEVLTVLREVTVAREMVECVLRATDRIEAAEDFKFASFVRVPLRVTASGRSECILLASSWAFETLRPPARLGVTLGVAFGGLNKSSTGTSISAILVSSGTL